MSSLKIKQAGKCVILSVKVIPGSSKTAISGHLDGIIKVKISAPPQKGKANQQLIDFLASKCGIKKKEISILSGKTSPLKQVQISGISAEQVIKSLGIIQ